jgi:hypothetical protein
MSGITNTETEGTIESVVIAPDGMARLGGRLVTTGDLVDGLTHTIVPKRPLTDLPIFGGPAASRRIEESEKRGQQELVASDLFPTQLHDPREHFEELGFVFGDVVADDPIFQHCTLPPGWRREGGDHAMWSDIVDEQGRKRVEVFYKAAFCDRHAFARLAIRFVMNVEDDTLPWDDQRWLVRDAKSGQVAFKPENPIKHHEQGRANGYTECRDWQTERAKSKTINQLWAEE